jgi:hypothetical protein
MRSRNHPATLSQRFRGVLRNVKRYSRTRVSCIRGAVDPEQVVHIVPFPWARGMYRCSGDLNRA